MMKNVKKIKFFIFLIALIDITSVGLLFPILPNLFFGNHPAFFTVHTSLHMRGMYFGLAAGMAQIGAIIGPPILGEFSDQIGRKNILIFCLISLIVGYAIQGFFIFERSFLGFMIARFLTGFFDGSYTIIQAMIADISKTSKEKIKNMSLVDIGFCAGIIIGPLFSIFTKGYHYATPFFLFSIIAGIIIIFSIKFIDETLEHKDIVKSKKTSRKFYSKNLIYLIIVFLLFQFGIFNFKNGVNAIMSTKFKSSTFILGIYWIFGGFGGIFAQMIQPKLLKHMKTNVFGILNLFSLIALTFILLIFWEFKICYWIIFPGAFMAELLFFNFIVALISNTVSSHSQGRVMGIVNGMYGLAAGVFSLFIGVLLELGLAFPIIGSLLFMIASFILLIIYLKINKNIAVEI